MTLFALPCGALQWAALATFATLLLNFLGYFDDSELQQYFDHQNRDSSQDK